jgi:hypothetical protein
MGNIDVTKIDSVINWQHAMTDEAIQNILSMQNWFCYGLSRMEVVGNRFVINDGETRLKILNIISRVAHASGKSEDQSEKKVFYEIVRMVYASLSNEGKKNTPNEMFQTAVGIMNIIIEFTNYELGVLVLKIAKFMNLLVAGISKYEYDNMPVPLIKIRA